jgi:mannose-6-phosphate isomerase-like protein (cupin superfamily)
VNCELRHHDGNRLGGCAVTPVVRHFRIRGTKEWKVWGGNRRAQAAEMTIEPGGSEGGPGNRHPRSDQWLFVISGRGVAIVKGRRVPLSEGALLLIEKGEAHEIRSLGRAPLRTLNLYVPPAY